MKVREEYLDKIACFRSIIDNDYHADQVIENYIFGNQYIDNISNSDRPALFLPAYGLAGSSVTPNQNWHFSGGHTVVWFQTLPASILVSFVEFEKYAPARYWNHQGVDVTGTEIITAGAVNADGRPFFITQLSSVGTFSGYWFIFPSGTEIASNDFGTYRTFPGIYTYSGRANAASINMNAFAPWDGAYRFGKPIIPYKINSDGDYSAFVVYAPYNETAAKSGIVYMPSDIDNTLAYSLDQDILFTTILPCGSYDANSNQVVQFQGLKFTPNQSNSGVQPYLLIQAL